MPAKIIRTPTRATGGITPAEKARMDEISKKWIARAFRTDPIEPEKITDAIYRLYDAADLKHPRVVIVPSPRVLALAGARATSWWDLRGKIDARSIDPVADDATRAATRDATDAATRAATYDATDAATRDATDAATRAATDAATYDATDAATRAATDDATRDATYAATYAATRAATYAATRAATYDATDAATRAATVRGWYYYQGGNMWASLSAYYEALRDVLGLTGLACWPKYQAWEDCSVHGGFRWMHSEFCMVSDFPEFIRIDAENRPHCENGPSHRWRDGWELWYWHGVAVTEQIIMRPETITARQLASEKNLEVRRIMIERMGWEKFCDLASMRSIHRDSMTALFPTVPVSDLVQDGERFVYAYREGREDAELLEAANMRDFEDRPLRFVRLSDPSTSRRYILRVPPSTVRCYEGVGWTFGMSESDYKSRVYARHGDVMLRPVALREGQSRHS